MHTVDNYTIFLTGFGGRTFLDTKTTIRYDGSVVGVFLQESKSGEMAHNLDDMAEHYLQYRTIRIEELIGTGKKQKRMDAIPTEMVAEYAGEDALVVWHLYPLLKERIEREPDLAKLLYDIEIPLLSVLAEMEFIGMTVDPEVLHTLSSRFAKKQAILEEEIYDLAGHTFNIASPKQLATVLFDELDLRPIKKTKSGKSIDVEENVGVHPGLFGESE